MDQYGNTINKLGSGTYGTVYETDKGYAIKKMNNDLPYIPNSTALREIVALNKIKQFTHQHTLYPVDILLNRNTTDLVLKLADTSLESLLGNNNLDWRDLFFQICLGVAEMHNADMIHLDLKPLNILIKDNQIWIGDFGATLTYTCALGGYPYENVTTSLFRSPELFYGGQLTIAADIWALGTMLYEIYLRLTKKANYPFGRNNFSDSQIVEDIYKYIGVPTEDHWSGVTSLPYWSLYSNLAKRIINGKRQNYVEELTSLNIDTNIIDLIGKMLTLNPYKRPTIYEVLQHPYFNGRLIGLPIINCRDSMILTSKYPINKWPNQNLRENFISHLVDFYTAYNLKKTTLDISIYLADNFIYKKDAPINYDLLLLCVIFIAVSIQETRYISIEKLLKLSNNLYTETQIIDMIKDLLLTLDFQLEIATLSLFIQYRIKTTDYGDNTQILWDIWEIIIYSDLIFIIDIPLLADMIYYMSKWIQFEIKSPIDLTPIKSVLLTNSDDNLLELIESA